MFEDWKEKSKDATISKSLLWEYDLDNLLDSMFEGE